MDNLNCPNKHNHISAFPAYDRTLCPYCKKTYILNEKGLMDVLLEAVRERQGVEDGSN